MSLHKGTGAASLRGARIAYEVAGHGPPVIWGHGMSMDRVSDAELGLVDWAAVPATVVRYDARGHGQSESTPDLAAYRWGELARDQLALADALGIDRYVAAGASMGCGTALHAALLAPDRVRAVVLVIPPTAWESRAAQAAQWADNARAIAAMGVEALIASRAALDLPDPFRADPAARREAQAAATRRWDARRLALVMEGAAGADLPGTDRIAALDVPTLILAWTGDPVHPIGTAESLAHLIPGARLTVASTAEDLVGWTATVAEFIRSLDPAAASALARDVR